MKAIWNGTVLAESDDVRVVDGAHYFPPDALRTEFLVDSDHVTRCNWKGEASYFHVDVEGRRNPNAAWSYRSPMPAVRDIQDHVAFWNGVELVAC